MSRALVVRSHGRQGIAVFHFTSLCFSSSDEPLIGHIETTVQDKIWEHESWSGYKRNYFHIPEKCQGLYFPWSADPEGRIPKTKEAPASYGCGVTAGYWKWIDSEWIVSRFKMCSKIRTL